MLYRSLKGFNDILPEDSVRWQWMEGIIHDLMRRYGYGEIRLPILESTELFKRGIGEGTDVVGKEMYTFLDKADPPESLTLRPELTASAARAYIEHAVGQAQPVVKWYYNGPAFRYERPQAGRLRQFHTFGIEVLADFLERAGIRRYRLRLNSIGTAEERTGYREALLDYLRQRSGELSEDSRRRMEGNPLRVLDSKREEDIRATAEAPSILDFLQEESRQHFATVREMLEVNGIPYDIDPRLVRGLDYYTRTAFEFQGLDLGAQDAIGGGGRYDRLIEEVGGKPTPAVGFGIGLERVLIALEKSHAPPAAAPELDVYIIGLDDPSRRWAAAMARTLRHAGLSTEHDLLRRSMKAQMREANRRGARLVVIAGENEIAAREAQVKEMQSGTQRGIPFDDLAGELLRAAREPAVNPEPLGPISES